MSNVIQIGGNARNTRETRRSNPNAGIDPCEIAALRALGRYVILSPGLFGLASGYSTSKSWDGLRGLFEKGLADRGYYNTEPTDQEIALAKPRVPRGLAYKLTSAGAKRAIAEGVANDGCALIRKRWNGHAPIGMPHRLLLAEFMIRMGLDIARQERLAIGRTFFDFIRVNNAKATKDQISAKRFITPDLVFDLDQFWGGKSTLVFAEIERYQLQPESSDPKRETIVTKLEPYNRYLTSPMRKMRGNGGDLVLYVMDQDDDHLEQILKAVPWDKVGDVRKRILFSTFDSVREHGVLNGVWLTHDGKTRGLTQ